MTHCCLRVGYSLMICTRQGSSHGITCIIWVLISSVWCEVTSKLWESTDSVGIPKEGNEGNDSPYSLDNLAFCCMDCFVRLGLPCIRRFVHLSVLDVNTSQKEMLSDSKALRMDRSVLELTDLLELDRHLQFSQNLCSFFLSSPSQKGQLVYLSPNTCATTWMWMYHWFLYLDEVYNNFAGK